ncbi:MAG: FAD-dependent monooxygenase [Candidatus Binatia bacterium]|nr:FAD-dependent monooxygenase [Candidatus Binatia bacterium]
MQAYDLVIVGGGVGGTALGGVLARAGLEVLIVERETEFVDRVRGEWIAPWGVAEVKRVGLYDRFVAAGGHHLARHIAFDEMVPPEMAAENPLPIGALVPGIPGPLCLEHVTLQNEALEQAVEAGAEFLRGVTAVQVTAGEQPRVRFTHESEDREVSCRLIVGADGRSSTVRRQLGLELVEDPVDHLIAGLLIDGANGWPDDLQAGGKVGDINYLIFPQGGGKIRLYADYDAAERGRFGGEGGAERMLAAFDMPCVPLSGAIAGAHPIGPCRSYPSSDSWLEGPPYVPGAVLMGDAAGYNDPINGQGVSVTMRDARILGELLLEDHDWRSEVFAPYAEERRERMRRLRAAALFATALNARFGLEDLERRRCAIERIRDDPLCMMPLISVMVGPEAVEAKYFEDSFRESVFAVPT